jgi:anti-anti-sigma factor
VNRPVYCSDDGRQYVLDDDGEPVYGVWLHPDEYSEPLALAKKRDCDLENTVANGRQFEQFCDAIRDGFDQAEIERLLRFRMEKRLTDLARPSDLKDVVFRIATQAEKEGWLHELLEKAVEANPGNPLLRAFHTNYPNFGLPDESIDLAQKGNSGATSDAANTIFEDSCKPEHRDQLKAEGLGRLVEGVDSFYPLEHQGMRRGGGNQPDQREAQPAARLIQVEREGGVFVVSLPQRFWAEEKSYQFYTELASLVDQAGCRRIVLSMKTIKYGPSVLYHALLQLLRKLRSHDGRLILCDVNPLVREVMAIHRLDGLFEFADDRESAIRQLSS